MMDELTWKKSPVLANVLTSDYTTTDITINIDECNSETLNLITEFMKGDLNIWKQITPFNVENLIIMAEYLNLEHLYDQCTVWIVKEVLMGDFQFSEKWKTVYSGLYDEMSALLKIVKTAKESVNFRDATLKATITGTQFFKMFVGIKRFSGLKVIVEGDIPIMTDIANLTSIRATSLEFYSSKNAQVTFLADKMTFPKLKTLSLKQVTDLTALSEALNRRRIPLLEELNISSIQGIQLDTFQLTNAINIKRLSFVDCRLNDLTSLAHVLNANKMPKLEVFNLSHNRDLQLKTFELHQDVPLKYLSLVNCGLNDASHLSNIFNNGLLANLEVLKLSQNNRLDLVTFHLDNGISLNLQRLDLNSCGLTDVTPLTTLLNNRKISKLKELNLSNNKDILLRTFQLEPHFDLKSLDFRDCGLRDISFLSKLLNDAKIPQLEELNLSNNRQIELSTFRLHVEIPLKNLKLSSCGLNDISTLARIMNDGKLQNLEELDLSYNYPKENNDDYRSLFRPYFSRMSIRLLFTEWKAAWYSGPQPIQLLKTFSLDKRTSIRRLKLQYCKLTDVSPLMHILNDDIMPNLEELNLSGNVNIQLKSLSLTNALSSIKRLDLDDCGLTDISPLSKILNEERMPNLEELNLSRNLQLDLTTFVFDHPIHLKRLNLAHCGLTNISPLAKLLSDQKIPNLEELKLSRNLFIELKTFRLDNAIMLKVLDLERCRGLKDIAFLTKLVEEEKMPKLQELNLAGCNPIKSKKVTFNNFHRVVEAV